MCQVAPITIEQMHHEWIEHFHLVQWLCRKNLFHRNISNPPDIDERVQEAIAHAWKVYPRLRERRPEFSARTAVLLATKTGISRVRSKTRFVSKPHRHYIDAMDRRTVWYSSLLIEIPDRWQQSVPTDSHGSTAEALIHSLPTELQPIAQMLSDGMTLRAVARSRGISETTLRAKIRAIRRRLFG